MSLPSSSNLRLIFLRFSNHNANSLHQLIPSSSNRSHLGWRNNLSNRNRLFHQPLTTQRRLKRNSNSNSNNNSINALRSLPFRKASRPLSHNRGCSRQPPLVTLRYRTILLINRWVNLRSRTEWTEAGRTATTAAPPASTSLARIWDRRQVRRRR